MKHFVLFNLSLLISLTGFTQLTPSFETTLCPSSPKLTCVISEPGANPSVIEYTWIVDGDEQIKKIGEQEFSITTSEGTVVEVECKVEDTTNPSNVGSFKADVRVASSPTITPQSNNMNLCEVEEVELTATIVPGAIDGVEHTYTGFKWTGTNAPGTEGISVNFEPPYDQGDQTYTLKVTDDFGCSYNEEITLEGLASTFTVSPLSGEAILKTTIKPTATNIKEYKLVVLNSKGEKIDSITGDDTSLNGGLTYDLRSPGIYDYVLNSTSDFCKVSERVSSINVQDSKFVEEMPNIFTPNGDGQNDFFTVSTDATSMKNYQIVIMNRWGKKVHEFEIKNIDNSNKSWKDNSNAWDGTINGSEATDGTYFYVINALGYDNIKYQYKGSLYLLRSK